MRRQTGLTVVLENIHDDHNIGAVLRTCDAVGISEIFVLHSEIGLRRKNIVLGKRTSAGARRWVDAWFYRDVETCFQQVRKDYDYVFGTAIGAQAKALYELDLTKSVALVFGNERDGLSQATLDHCDGNFLIPMMGFVQSLNVSVACAVTLFEALRQRRELDYYGEANPLSLPAREALFKEYVRRHEDRVVPRRGRKEG